MDDSLLVSMFDRVTDSGEQLQTLRDAEVPPAGKIEEGAALDIFHGKERLQVGGAAGGSGFENLRNTWMPQPGQHLGLLAESANEVGGKVFAADHLERHQ